MLLAIVLHAQKRLVQHRPIAIALSLLCVSIPVILFARNEYTPYAYTLLLSFFMLIAGIVVFYRTSRFPVTVLAIALIFMHIIPALYTNPLMKGLDAIYSRPVAQAVLNTAKADPTSKWIGIDILFPVNNFLVACGAPTLSSAQYIPNFDLWRKIDENADEYYYNRYAHLSFSLAEDDLEFELYQSDHVGVSLPPEKIASLDVRYVVTPLAIESFEKLNPQVVYKGTGLHIYRLNY
jgi:hypothetical protein